MKTLRYLCLALAALFGVVGIGQTVFLIGSFGKVTFSCLVPLIVCCWPAMAALFVYAVICARGCPLLGSAV